jgi:hypothetical protein
MRLMLGFALCCSTLAACGSDGGGDAGTGSETSGASVATSTTTSSTTAATTESSSAAETSGSSGVDDSSGGSTGVDVELQHGFVHLLLQADPAGMEDPFVGTNRIEVTMLYEECLFGFYEANPSWAQTGPDGEDVFGPLSSGGEGWLDRLCEVPLADLVDCQVETISQQLDPIPALRVTYSVDAMLDGRVLPFGPLPTAELAQCEGGTLPTVRITNGDAIRGFDGVDPVWHALSFEPDSAATDQPEPIAVVAEPI